MISVDEALQLVLSETVPLPAVEAPLHLALGRTLAEDIVSDIDSPPTDKSLVDGYAVIASDLANRLEAGSPAVLRVLEEVVAGAVPTHAVTAATATRIMTGAPLPDGADAVVMIEQTEQVASGGDSMVRISPPTVPAERNLMRRGTSFRQGQVVLTAGRRLRAMEIGLLAEVGRDAAPVFRAPRVSILSTGNELVEARTRPGLGQIRNSNGPMLAAQVTEAGGEPVALGIARDDASELRRLIAEGLESDVLVLSGGVSAGVLDLVPAALAELGVRPVFHKIRLKPGKPLYFGVAAGDRSKLVFGLPGNPVSSLVCFHLFVRPALAKLAGDADPTPAASPAALAHSFDHRGDRPTYFPAAVSDEAGCRVVKLTAWKGSADLRSLADANCLACFPEGERKFEAGETVDVLLF